MTRAAGANPIHCYPMRLITLLKSKIHRATVTEANVPELDALTCRLVQQRFVYRPSTDRYGRPIEDEVEGEHDWVARSR